MPAMAYCEPRRFRLTISRNSPVALGEPATNADDVVVGAGRSATGGWRPSGSRSGPPRRGAPAACMAEPRWNTTSSTASSGSTPATAASALYSPTEWPASSGALDEGTGLAQLGDLCDTEDRHRDLGELGQVQHAVRVPVLDTAGLEVRSGCRGPRRGSRSRAPCGCACRRGPRSHGRPWSGCGRRGPCPWRWMPWPGNAYDGLRRGGAAGRDHHQVTVDAAGDLDDLGAGVDRDPVDRTSMLAPGRTMPRKRAVQAVSVADAVLDSGSTATTACCAAAESHMPCTIGCRARRAGPRRRRCGSGCGRRKPGRTRPCCVGATMVTVAATATRGVDGVGAHRATGARRIGQLALAGAAADREPLDERGEGRRLDALVTHRADGRRSPRRRGRGRCRAPRRPRP